MAPPGGMPSGRDVGSRPAVAVFPFIAGNHPLAAELDALRALIAFDAGLAAHAQPGTLVHREIRAAPDGTARRRLVRFYWSVQAPDPAAPGGLRGRMLLLDARLTGGEPAMYDFPADPGVPAAARADSPLVAGGAVGVRVLRYIPLRRITFYDGAPGGGEPVVGKIKRRTSTESAHARLTDVWRAVERSPGGFAVPAPKGVDLDRGVQYQQAMPGRPLVAELTSERADAAMERFGAIHAELHQLPVDAPAVEEAQRRALAEDADWVGFAAPEQREAVDRVHAWVARRVAGMPPAATAYCHGDLSPSQVLVSGDTWTVVDFDDAHRGDAYLEIGAVLAGMAREGAAEEPLDPATAERLEAAYLAGYRARSGRPIDEPRLHVRRVEAGIRQLATRLRKGRALPGEAERCVGRLLELTGA
ncbi:MAG: Phosphotransferase enzyme family [Solirubrobacteraceae bacterium]|nr:Phosphotransferase enzyme family [Solirubrobacteraceae bacterium]